MNAGFWIVCQQRFLQSRQSGKSVLFSNGTAGSRGTSDGLRLSSTHVGHDEDVIVSVIDYVAGSEQRCDKVVKMKGRCKFVQKKQRQQKVYPMAGANG